MAKTWFAFGSLTGETPEHFHVARRSLDPCEAKAILAQGEVMASVRHERHAAKLEALREFHGIAVALPETLYAVTLRDGDQLITASCNSPASRQFSFELLTVSESKRDSCPNRHKGCCRSGCLYGEERVRELGLTGDEKLTVVESMFLPQIAE